MEGQKGRFFEFLRKELFQNPVEKQVIFFLLEGLRRKKFFVFFLRKNFYIR